MQISFEFANRYRYRVDVAKNTHLPHTNVRTFHCSHAILNDDFIQIVSLTTGINDTIHCFYLFLSVELHADEKLTELHYSRQHSTSFQHHKITLIGLNFNILDTVPFFVLVCSFVCLLVYYTLVYFHQTTPECKLDVYHIMLKLYRVLTSSFLIIVFGSQRINSSVIQTVSRHILSIQEKHNKKQLQETTTATIRNVSMYRVSE